MRVSTNVELALRSVKTSRPDLVLLDIHMPPMEGCETCKRFKADIPIIFLSALSERLDKLKAFEVGGVDYIVKPFELLPEF